MLGRLVLLDSDPRELARGISFRHSLPNNGRISVIMHRRIAAVLLTAGTVGLGTTSSFAATATWTVSPGSSFTAQSHESTLTDSKTGIAMSCSSSHASGALKTGTGLTGAGIGSITALAFGNCTAGGLVNVTGIVTNGHFPWKLNAVSYKSGVTSGTITGIHAMVSGAGCSAALDGTSASADNGEVSIMYTNSTGALKILSSGADLHIYDVSGCAGLIGNGDPTTLAGTYTLAAKQMITES